MPPSAAPGHRRNPDQGPSGWSEHIVSRDGTPILIRAIRPQDKPALVKAFEGLSEETRERRFFAPIKHLTTADLHYFTEVDHTDHEALVAIAANGQLIGVARYIGWPEKPTMAEVAVVVADDWQGRGIGSSLLTRLTLRARAAGVKAFTATCLS